MLQVGCYIPATKGPCQVSKIVCFATVLVSVATRAQLNEECARLHEYKVGAVGAMRQEDNVGLSHEVEPFAKAAAAWPDDVEAGGVRRSDHCSVVSHGATSGALEPQQ